MASTLWARIACWTVLSRAIAAGLCFAVLLAAAECVVWVAAPLLLEDFEGVAAVDVVVPPDEAVVDVVPAVPSLPEAALLAFDVVTA
jgi:hypothetical protein